MCDHPDPFFILPDHWKKEREKEKRRRAKTELESSFVFIAPVEKARVLNRDRNPFYSGLIFSKKSVCSIVVVVKHLDCRKK